MQYHMPASLLQQEPAGTNMRRLKEIQILVLFSHIMQKRKSLQKLQPQNEIYNAPPRDCRPPVY